jgi:hypothetical protein
VLARHLGKHIPGNPTIIPQSPINCVMHNGSRPVSAVKQSAGVKIATTGVSRPAW